MAVFNFADFAGQTIADFDVENDILLIEAGTFGSASAFKVAQDGDNLILRASNGQTVVLADVSIYTVSPTNVLWDDQSAIRAGDEDETSDNDAVDAAQAAIGATESDYVYGSTVTDNLTATGEFASYVQGAEGADNITASAASTGNHTLRGGSGADVITVDADEGDITVTGDLGDDDIDVDGDANVTLNGGAGADDITVSGGGTTFARGGADDDNFVLDATAGTHTVWGDLGADEFDVTGDADFVIYGDNLNNLSQSGADEITISAGSGDHLFNGMGGNDVIVVTGGTGASTLRGGAGDDSFDVSGASGLLLRGDKGVDDFDVTLTAGQTVTIEGGEGADTYSTLSVTGAGAVATISDFSSEDTVTLAGGVAASAAALTVTRDSGGVTLTNTASVEFEGFTGNFTADNIAAFTDGSILLTNWGGDADTLTGTCNADYIAAGNNGDTIVSGGGADVLQGGTGADTFQFASRAEAAAAASIVGGAGVDTLEFTAAVAGVVSTDIDTATGVEVIKFAVGNNSIDLAGVAATVGVTTIDSTESVTGNTVGIDLDDETSITVNGGGGSEEVIINGTATHTLNLYAGDDTVTFESGALVGSNVLRGGLGTDELILSDDAQTVSFGSNIRGFETITLDDAAVTLNFTADYNATLATGVDLTIDGAAATSGGSTVTVNASAITVDMAITGGDLADTIVAGSGDDTIDGGDGANSMTGGAGADTFVFDSTLSDSTAVNFITDFNADEDIIDADLLPATFGDFSSVDYDGEANLAAAATAAIADAGNTALQAVLFTYDSRTYIAIDDGDDAYANGDDVLVDVTGFTGTLTVADFI